MILIYRDKLGSVAVCVDQYGIACAEGFAYFSSEGKSYKIPVCDILSIVSND